MSHPNLPSAGSYSYDGPERLERKKPYSFSEFQGASFLRAFTRSRDALREALDAGSPSISHDFAGLERLARDADALRPENLVALGEEMLALRMAWDVESAAQDTDTTEILEQIIMPYLRARVPMRALGEGASWAHGIVVLLLERFEAYGCVHSRYDRDWRKTESDPNSPSVVVRLALAAGWLGWSDLFVDASASLAHLNVLLKLDDLIAAGLTHGGWVLTPIERDAARAALLLEDRLLRHWRRDRSLVLEMGRN